MCAKLAATPALWTAAVLALLATCLGVAVAEVNPPIDAFDRNLCGKRTGTYDKHLEQIRAALGPPQGPPVSRRISSGWPTGPGEIPWHVSIRSQPDALVAKTYDCAGIIVHRDLVLTAARCVRFDQDPEASGERRYVIGGQWHILEKSYWQVRSYLHPSDAVWHPDHVMGDFKGTSRNPYDVAIIRLNASFEYNDFVQPACLHDLENNWDPPHNYCLTAGYGKSKDEPDTEWVHNHLMALPMRPAYCDIPRDEGCWESANPAKHPGKACLGDYGAGMYCLNKEETAFYAFGVFSHASDNSCAPDKGGVTVYTDFFLMQFKFADLFERMLGRDAVRPPVNRNPPLDSFNRVICGRRTKNWPRHLDRRRRRTGRRVSAGWPASQAEFPWHVTIRTNIDAPLAAETDCSGIIIHRNMVLTAAHCVHWVQEKRKQIPRRYVIGGTANWLQKETRQVRSFRHPVDALWPARHRANESKPPYDPYGHDYAIIKLDNDFEYNEHVQPACLHDIHSTVSLLPDYCVTMGYGKREDLPPFWSWYMDTLYAMPLQRAVCNEFRRLDEFCWESVSKSHVGKPCHVDDGAGIYCTIADSEVFYALGTYSHGSTKKCTPGKNEVVHYLDLWYVSNGFEELIERALAHQITPYDPEETG